VRPKGPARRHDQTYVREAPHTAVLQINFAPLAALRHFSNILHSGPPAFAGTLELIVRQVPEELDLWYLVFINVGKQGGLKGYPGISLLSWRRFGVGQHDEQESSCDGSTKIFTKDLSLRCNRIARRLHGTVKVSASAPEGSLPDLSQLFTEPYDSYRRGQHVRRRGRDVLRVNSKQSAGKCAPQ